jgi:putative Holliday junction resolvase
MRIMSLDLGSKTIGVALSDELTITAQVLTSIHRTALAKDLEAILRLVEDHQVEELVIGLPINMDGSRGGAVDKVETFVAHLSARLTIKIIPWDERLSTVAAERILLEGDLSRAKRRKVIDRLAAAIILQGFSTAAPEARVNCP